ncbi:MAG: hypothetical protein JXX28_13690 [Deltaproteobacteria bacterium]|nr:hypothetical protein [Deltaproteobacteria bacterium]
MSPERLEELMVKVVDRAATPAEEEELLAWAADRPEVMAELERHRALKAVTDGWVARLEGELHQDRERQISPLRGLGLALFALALAVLLGGGLTELLLDEAAPLWAKGGTALLLGSLFLLFLSVLRGRLATHDPYNEVTR